MGHVQKGDALGEPPSVNSHNDPCVWEQLVRLLKLLDIFESWILSQHDMYFFLLQILLLGVRHLKGK